MKLKLLTARVDWLELAYRVKLDEGFVAHLRARAEVAKQHGRAGFSWTVRAPDDDGDGTIASMRRIGRTPGRQPKIAGLRLRWADEAERVKHVSSVWGELHFSKQEKVWVIVNEPFFRLRVELNAPGGGELRDCLACKGKGWVSETEVCMACDAKGTEEEPGWTVSIRWYAQTLADWGLDATMQESAALVSTLGDVLETRLRRLDLCADVQGFEVRPGDVRKLAKRPRARWSVYEDGSIGHVDDLTGRVKGSPVAEGVNVYGAGKLRDRRITGMVAGRGGAMQARIYDKRAELASQDTQGERTKAEEARWIEAGWDGVSPVGRVEFQIRGVALAELGLRDPDAVLEPTFALVDYVDAHGKARKRRIVTGHRVLTVKEADGREVQATLSHRLDDIWATCLDWGSLVVLEKTRGGKDKSVSRLKDDPRWTELRKAKFSDVRKVRTIRRYRIRGAASPAQALGVALSQAGRDGELLPMDERRSAYKDDEHHKKLLFRRVMRLKRREAEKIVAWLIERFGGVDGALEHLAVRSNAARLRFLRGVLANELSGEGDDPPVVEAA